MTTIDIRGALHDGAGRYATGGGPAPGYDLGGEVTGPASLALIDNWLDPVCDEDGDPITAVTVTPGLLDDNARHAYRNGHCLALALAVADATGGDVVLRYEPVDGEDDADGNPLVEWSHAYGRTPDGRLWDVDGLAYASVDALQADLDAQWPAAGCGCPERTRRTRGCVCAPHATPLPTWDAADISADYEQAGKIPAQDREMAATLVAPVLAVGERR